MGVLHFEELTVPLPKMFLENLNQAHIPNFRFLKICSTPSLEQTLLSETCKFWLIV